MAETAACLATPRLENLISRVQAAVISTGTELERIIKNEVEQIDSIEDFLKKQTMLDDVFMASKQQIKKSHTLNACRIRTRLCDLSADVTISNNAAIW